MSATTIPTDTVSDNVLNISSQNCEEFWFLPRATVLIGNWQAESAARGGLIDHIDAMRSVASTALANFQLINRFLPTTSLQQQTVHVFTFSPAISRARSCLMSAKPNLEFRKRGNMSWAKKYRDCCAFASIYESGSRRYGFVCQVRQFVIGNLLRKLEVQNVFDESNPIHTPFYLGVDRVHVGLGHVANDDLVVGAIEQLVVVHHTVHSF